MPFRIRPYRPGDLDALYDICLLTGDSGQDASGLYEDPKLLGHVYAAAYGIFQPEFAFVVDDELGVAGYVIGALDSRAFEATLEREWWPNLREQYPRPTKPKEDWTPDDRIINLLYGRSAGDEALLDAYPSHLHIDLLPRAQGGGNGRKLMHTLFDALARAGSPGVHLGVGARNTRAVGFYEHIGFERLAEKPGSIVFGMKLPFDAAR
ncbi:GNAT family N-acetyltransferase [Deinococcus yavapaiensis]|uniref:Acetyltransferase (GNAT) family protein n=1 Tax=Deinococcus yavapaiensis KR-236 TaxID=694435 RepID=A0A318SCR8_9DEIO|nr:GNAT family N-acetyltransferase [Deinococcus yavapaiensis]PYE54158.1 acetyltransferase (GNAT) family protein [Deinococcus yavapaiensis KR-236]